MDLLLRKKKLWGIVAVRTTAPLYTITLNRNPLLLTRSLRVLAMAILVAVAPVEISAATAAVMAVEIAAEMEGVAVVDAEEEIKIS